MDEGDPSEIQEWGSRAYQMLQHYWLHIEDDDPRVHVTATPSL